MGRLRGLREEIPEHVCALEIALRVSLLGVDEIREFNRVSDEEHWSVVANLKTKINQFSLNYHDSLVNTPYYTQIHLKN